MSLVLRLAPVNRALVGNLRPLVSLRLAGWRRCLTDDTEQAGKTSLREGNVQRAVEYLKKYGSNAKSDELLEADPGGDIPPPLYKRKQSSKDLSLARIKKHLPVVTGDVPDSATLTKLLELEHGAFDINVMDVGDKAPFTNELIVCSALTPNHVLAIADGLKDDMRRCEVKVDGEVVGICGRGSKDWMVVDIGVTVVHVMTEEARQLYDLEGLWTPKNMTPPPYSVPESDQLRT